MSIKIVLQKLEFWLGNLSSTNLGCFRIAKNPYTLSKISLCLFFAVSIFAQADIFRDLQIVEDVNRDMSKTLPIFYNNIGMAGYISMPSARMAEMGTLALQVAHASPYTIYAGNFQVFGHVELAGTYRIFNGMEDPCFKGQGFGDEADRGANIKLALLKKSDGFYALPNFAVGWNDFHGSCRFPGFYVVMTEEWSHYNLEATLGWGKDRIDGFFGGIAWSPFRHLSLIVEYDANNYQKNSREHPKGQKVSSRINVGAAVRYSDHLQFRFSTLRGEDFSALVNFAYNLGNSTGIYPKIDDPRLYTAPINLEPIGPFREEKELSSELAVAFCRQGLSLMDVYLTTDHCNRRNLWLKIINTRYREEEVLRERLSFLLSALSPSNIYAITVAVEADGIIAQSYTFRTEDLERFRLGMIGPFELETLSPLRDCACTPSPYESPLIYRRKKDPWTLTIRPRILTFFGSAKGKFKYAFGFVAGPEGYFHNKFYYKLQVGYNIKSSMSDVGDIDQLNPSQLLHVRSDSVEYFKSNTLTLEQAYMQRGVNAGGGFFLRIASGYFEPAYAGLAAEMLYFPVRSDFAIGASAATVLKRKYQGLGFTTKVRRYKKFEPFVGYQAFLDLYYLIRPLHVDLKAKIGSFLARDLGVRFEMTKNYYSGVRFSLWYTLTNGHDRVNGKHYNDKGFLFEIPLDLFLKQSSRSYVQYEMNAWLRDVGAIAATGKTLWETIRYERM